MNDNSTSVDIPPDPGKGNGATESVYKTPGKGEINDKADSVINIPENTVEETDANYIADTAVWTVHLHKWVILCWTHTHSRVLLVIF